MATSGQPQIKDIGSPYGKVVLVHGSEGLLADRAIEDLVAACRAEDPTVEVAQTSATTLDGGDLLQMTSGSLFATRSVLVVDDLADASDSLARAVASAAADPAPEIALVLVHRGGNKGKGLVDKLKKARVPIFPATPLKPRELVGFVEHEARLCSARLDRFVAQQLVDAVGVDLRALAGAVRQLAEDSEDGTIRAELVQGFFQGRAEVKGFTIADAALEGQTSKALTELRWALSSGTAPVLITSAMASGIRGLGRLSSIRGRGNDGEVAADIGVPPWKLRTLRQQLQRWDDLRLARAVRIVARADADVKGAADDPDHALETMVLQISRLASRP
ncbi:DNA polymerase III, delta subunit [Raineyella antarctica]|uniref:DNA-directed DNA polymerase n=1 Tax=Raineyella antarctica TaxID=1577474 RepID=A0A1G6GY44_9ACTN|nr:DNA polymerase III subunit delta [Raineyella antarctica]SDB86854.1 DNA polymerase III, delta subunit [Raineyella antarctica]